MNCGRSISAENFRVLSCFQNCRIYESSTPILGERERERERERKTERERERQRERERERERERVDVSVVRMDYSTIIYRVPSIFVQNLHTVCI